MTRFLIKPNFTQLRTYNVSLLPNNKKGPDFTFLILAKISQKVIIEISELYRLGLMVMSTNLHAFVLWQKRLIQTYFVEGNVEWLATRHLMT